MEVELKNKTNEPQIIILDKYLLKNKLSISSEVILTSEEKSLFLIALFYFEKYIELNSVDINSLKGAFVLLVKDGNYSIVQNASNIGGYTGSVIVYIMDFLRNGNYTDDQFVAIILEELCHHFFNISDEIKVKYKVLDVMRLGNNKLSLTDIYRESEVAECRRILKNG